MGTGIEGFGCTHRPWFGGCSVSRKPQASEVMVWLERYSMDWALSLCPLSLRKPACSLMVKEEVTLGEEEKDVGVKPLV